MTALESFNWSLSGGLPVGNASLVDTQAKSSLKACILLIQMGKVINNM